MKFFSLFPTRLHAEKRASGRDHLSPAFGRSTGAAAAANVIAITGGNLLTVSHGTIDNGTLIMADGKIAAVGDAGKVKIPTGAQIVDAKGLTVYPGLIDPESNFGLTEISADQMTNDLVERSDEIMPHMHVYDAFHSETELIPVARLNGITNAVVAPASDDTICRTGHLHPALRRRPRPDDPRPRCRPGHELRRRPAPPRRRAVAAEASAANIPPRAWA